MHYKSGIEAHVGDMVRGPSGYGYDIVGRVVALYQQAQSCNARVACVTKQSQLMFCGSVPEPVVYAEGQAGCRAYPYDVTPEAPSLVLAEMIYCTVGDFEKVA